MHDRFYIENNLNLDEHADKEIEIASITGHLKAFRKKSGDEIRLYDCRGNIYHSVILEISKKYSRLKIFSKEFHAKGALKIHLFLPFIASHLMDRLISRVSELEIASIHPVTTSRSLALKDGAGLAAKMIKWDKISKESCILSGRNYQAKVEMPQSLEDSFKVAGGYDIKLLASPGARVYLKEFLGGLDHKRKVKDIGLFIGPEGDFSPGELKLSEKYGILGIKLSNFIMSTFTASIYFASNIACFFSSGYAS